MASLRNALSKILSGKNDFCCSCFKDIEENEITFENITVDDGQNFAELSQILEYIFDKNVLNTIFKIGGLCKQCKVSALNSYKFIKMCNENSKNLFNCVEIVTETLDNVREDVFHCNSVFVSLNMNDFTSKQYYDDKHPVSSQSSAYKRFSSLVRLEKKPVISIVDNSDISRNVGKVSNKVSKKRNLMNYDIPTIPTSYIVLDSHDRYFKCKVCFKPFQKIDKLRQHFFRYHYPKDVKCSKCPRSFISNQLLKIHKDEYHNDLFCSQCGKNFKDIYVLKKHENNHNLKIICEDCGRVYRSKEAFNKHVTDNICKQRMRKSSEQGKYFCDYCNKRYCHKPYLAKHIKYEHENAEGFKCQFCDKKFYTPSGLQSHIVKHTLEKKFDCLICDRKFVSKQSLIYHTRLHTGEKPYQCEFCDMAFLSASRRLDHTRRHHMAPTLECNICHSKFKGTGSLLKHKKRHLNPNSRLNNSQFMCKEQSVLN